MPTRDEVIAKTKKLIEENVPDMYGKDLKEDTILNVEGNVDSMGFILVLTKLEGFYNVKIPDDEWDSLRTLGDVADAVLRNLNKDSK
ncbi:MAG: acyl carrier protein [Erysipelotrichaceae bacterium]|nr:acyl carrier protein [Erysipelotrichaceae bacterium]